MSLLYGTNSAWGAPVTVELSFDGTVTPWGTANLYSMSPLSNRSESIDGGYEISELGLELIDTNGSVWNTLGNGTTCMNKVFSATVYVGGRLDYASYGPNSASRLQLLDLVNSATYTVHQGRVTDVSKDRRLVRIKSKNNLRAIADLEWRFPFTTGAMSSPSVLGTYIFTPNNVATFFANSAFDMNEEGNKFSVYAAVATTQPSDVIDVLYPPIAGRGTLGRLSGYRYPGTQFYFDCPRLKMAGTWLTDFSGTIDTIELANQYGFNSLSAAEAAHSGTRYPINKTRLNAQSGTLPTGSWLYFQQNLKLTETPTNLFKELIAGHCSSPFFGTADIDSNTFAQSQAITTYQTFEQIIDPQGGKVAPYLKNLIESVYGAFNVNTNNRFEFRAYGPKNLQQSIGTLNGTDIVDANYSNSFDTFKNRAVIKYGFDFNSGEYTKQFELRGSSWAGTTDNPFTLESKWLRNENEVGVLAYRLMARFANGVPRISVTLPLKYVGAEIGSLFQVFDEDSGLGGKVLEVTGYEKDVTEQRNVVLSGIDGDVLYNRKGYGYWMGGTVQPSGNVSGTSTFGWGTGGTMAGINQQTYGSQFVWW